MYSSAHARMSENPAIYLKRLRMTRQIMFSYRPFISQMSTVCFLELSFLCIGYRALSGADWASVRSGGFGFAATSTNFCLAAVFPFTVPFQLAWHCIK